MRRALLAVAIAGAPVISGCAAAPSSDAADPEATTPSDAVLGTVAVVGADPLTRVVLQTEAGEQVTLTGADLDALRRLDGVEVRCRGVRGDSHMTVAAFRVVGAHGLPATDGVLELSGDAAVLVAPDGERVTFQPIPSDLLDLVGGRVWIAGPPGGEPEAWGIIAPPG